MIEIQSKVIETQTVGNINFYSHLHIANWHEYRSLCDRQNDSYDILTVMSIEISASTYSAIIIIVIISHCLCCYHIQNMCRLYSDDFFENQRYGCKQWKLHDVNKNRFVTAQS